MMKNNNNIIIRYFNILYHRSLIFKYLINFFSLIFIVPGFIYFYKAMNGLGFLTFIFSVSFSLLYSNYFKDKFANNKIIRFLQKFVLFSLLLFILVFVLQYLGID